MRFTIFAYLLTVVIAIVVAGPISKISDKKSLTSNTKLAKEAPKIDEIGADKDRSKKSTATFCLEIRPGSNEPVQCSCKDRETHIQHLAAQQISQAAPHPTQLQPASPHSVNIIHAPAQAPPTLNIIQPAPTLHAVQFLQPQSPNPSNVQTLNFLQPSSPLSEPFHQNLHFTLPSNQEEKPATPVQYERIVELPSKPTPIAIYDVVPETTPQSTQEVIVVPPEPKSEVVVIPETTPEILPEPEHTDSAHKSEIHVSVTTEDKKDQKEDKYQPVTVIEPVLPYASQPQRYEEQVVVVPNPILVQHQENCPSNQIPALIQIPSIRYQPSESIIQLPESSVQHTGPFNTECSCKQTGSVHSNLHLANPVSTRRHHHGSTQFVPMVIYPPAAQSAPSLSVLSSPTFYRETVSRPDHESSRVPTVIGMQSVRNKGAQEEMTNMANTDQNWNMLNNMNEERANHLFSSPLMSDAAKLRFVRNDKNAKITDKTMETNKITEKTSSIKTV